VRRTRGRAKGEISALFANHRGEAGQGTNYRTTGALWAATPAVAGRRYLIRKSSFLSFVPFISARIHTGVMPLPVHCSDLFFFDWYLGFGFARFPVRPLLGATA
jgi:hypothetical protein